MQHQEGQNILLNIYRYYTCNNSFASSTQLLVPNPTVYANLTIFVTTANTHDGQFVASIRQDLGPSYMCQWQFGGNYLQLIPVLKLILFCLILDFLLLNSTATLWNFESYNCTVPISTQILAAVRVRLSIHQSYRDLNTGKISHMIIPPQSNLVMKTSAYWTDAYTDVRKR